MKKILLPLEETDRSMKALEYAISNYRPEEAEFVLLMVNEKLGFTVKSEAEAEAIREIKEKLSMIAAALEGYRVTLASAVGKAGLRITRCARETGADLIIMSKSSKEDMLNSVGTTTEYVINNAPCAVLIVSEAVNSRNEYRGLVYKTSKGTVNLRGQLGDKQSECLLPSVNQDCIYHIEVTVGKIRFFHTAYNPDTRNWDLPPLPGQEVTMDILAGESKNILVKADSTDGKADRIRIVNRDMKKEAVFSFRISAVGAEPVPPVEEEPKTKPDFKTEAIENRATIEMEKVHEPAIPESFEAPEVPTFMADGRDMVEEIRAEQIEAEKDEAGESKAEDTKAEEPQGEENKAEETKTEETETEGPKAEENKAEETESEENRDGEIRVEPVLSEETRTDQDKDGNDDPSGQDTGALFTVEFK